MSQLTHLVLFKVRPDAADRDVDGALAALRARGAARPCAEDHGASRGVAVGPDVSAEGLAQGHTHAARDGYLPHPAHLAVVDQLTPLLDSLTVVDVVTP